MTNELTNQQDRSGYDLMRHELLPLLLGEEEPAILYWAGKALVRQRSHMAASNLAEFFAEAQWGTLHLVKEKKYERIYEVETSAHDSNRPFTLETGVIAQTVELEKGLLAEATYEIRNKEPLTVRITVRWDKKDSVTEE
jgi:predicted hydrocarbon binding protein